MVAIAVSSPDIIANNNGPKYFATNDGTIVEELFRQKLPGLNAFGSVATLCLSTAYEFGCNPIIFIGQDLAFTDNKTHADTIGAKTFDVNERDYKYLVDGYYGGKVPTDNSLEGFLRWIEDFIRDNNNSTFINATEGGAKIKGTIQMTFEEVVKQYTIPKPLIKHELKIVDANNVEKNLSEIVEPYDALKICIKQILDVKDMMREGVKLTNDIINEHQKGNLKSNDRLQKLIRKVDKRVGNNIPTNNAVADEAIKIAYSKININQAYKPPLHETVNERQIRLATMTNHTYQIIIAQLDKVLEILEVDEEN